MDTQGTLQINLGDVYMSIVELVLASFKRHCSYRGARTPTPSRSPGPGNVVTRLPQRQMDEEVCNIQGQAGDQRAGRRRDRDICLSGHEAPLARPLSRPQS